MESVGISVANFPLQKTKKAKSNSCHPLLQHKNILKINASQTAATVYVNNQKKPENWLGRREVICNGALVLATLLSFPSDSKSCDFTSSPSGLAYCDQALGAGPPPIKGQLIKVIFL